MQVPDVTIEQAQLIGLEVLYWRYEELTRAGYPSDIANLLSTRADVDLHEACELLAHGCTIHQALRILAQLP